MSPRVPKRERRGGTKRKGKVKKETKEMLGKLIKVWGINNKNVPQRLFSKLLQAGRNKKASW